LNVCPGDNEDVFYSALGQPVAAMFEQRLPVTQVLRRELSYTPVMLDHLVLGKNSQPSRPMMTLLVRFRL